MSTTRLPLDDFRGRRSSSAHPKALIHLPDELIIEILQISLQGDLNQIARLLSLARVCYTYASLIRSSTLLWALASAQARTRDQLLFVDRLAHPRPLHIVARGNPLDFESYIHRASVLHVHFTTPSWIQILSDKNLPALRELTCPDYTPAIILNTPALHKLSAGGPFQLVYARNLRSLQLQSGFGIVNFSEDFRKLLEECHDHLLELRIDTRWREAGRNSEESWQTVLQPLSGGPLRKLQLMDDDGRSYSALEDLPIIDLRHLISLESVSVLRLHPAQDVERVIVSCRDSFDLRGVLLPLTSALYVSITITSPSYSSSNYPDRAEGTGEPTLSFPRLRAIECRSSVDMQFIRFLKTSTIPPNLQLQLQIPFQREQRSQSDRTWSSCSHLSLDQRAIVDRVAVLNALRSIMETRGSDQAVALSIATYAPVGGEPLTIFAAAKEGCQISRLTEDNEEIAGTLVRVSTGNDWCPCTLSNGYPVTPVHALTAFAGQKFNRLYMPLLIERHAFSMVDARYRWAHHGSAPDTGDSGPNLSYWSPPDPLAAPQASDFVVLCANISVLRDVEEIHIDVVRSRQEVGVGILKAIIFNNTAERDAVGSVTFPKAWLFHFHIPENCNSVGRRRCTFWSEVEDLVTLRCDLAQLGRCPVPRVRCSGNLCTCTNRMRNGRYEFSALLREHIVIDQREGGCMKCA